MGWVDGRRSGRWKETEIESRGQGVCQKGKFFFFFFFLFFHLDLRTISLELITTSPPHSYCLSSNWLYSYTPISSNNISSIPLPPTDLHPSLHYLAPSYRPRMPFSPHSTRLPLLISPTPFLTSRQTLDLPRLDCMKPSGVVYDQRQLNRTKVSSRNDVGLRFGRNRWIELGIRWNVNSSDKMVQMCFTIDQRCGVPLERYASDTQQNGKCRKRPCSQMNQSSSLCLDDPSFPSNHHPHQPTRHLPPMSPHHPTIFKRAGLGASSVDSCGLNCLTGTTAEDCQPLDAACLCYDQDWHTNILVSSLPLTHSLSTLTCLI